jgi:hypothetical protein
MSRSVEITSPKQGLTNLWKLDLLGIATLDDFPKRLKSFAILSNTEILIYRLKYFFQATRGSRPKASMDHRKDTIHDRREFQKDKRPILSIK